MDDLICNETFGEHELSSDHRSPQQEEDRVLNVVRDNVLNADIKILNRLRANQKMYMVRSDYLQANQQENPGVTANIRNILAHWMLEVCEYRHMEDQVFMVAINILDRFLNVTPVRKEQLQLTACACLLLASKMRHCMNFGVETLVYFTDDSVSLREIREWEICILQKLEWDINPVTTLDFIAPILEMLPEFTNNEQIRKHAIVYASLAATDVKFMDILPSDVAAACVLMALNGAENRVQNTVIRITSCVETTVQDLMIVKDYLSETIAEFTNNHPNGGGGDAENQPVNDSNNNNQDNVNDHFLGDKLVKDASYEASGQTTPTDIIDVEF